MTHIFFQTNRAQGVEREIIEDFRTDETEEFIDQSEHGCCEKDAVASYTAVPSRGPGDPGAYTTTSRGHPRRPRNGTHTPNHQTIMIFTVPHITIIKGCSQNQCRNRHGYFVDVDLTAVSLIRILILNWPHNCYGF